jgi:predicted MFS family arabinose efflux permease
VAGSGGSGPLAPDAVPPLMFVAYGAAGLAGLAAGWLERRIGTVGLLAVIFASLAGADAIIALAPAPPALVVLSASLEGAAVMLVSATLSFWTVRVTPSMPTAGFTVVLLSLASGAVSGPWVAGLGLDAVGPMTVFVCTSAVSCTLLVALGWFRRRIAGVVGRVSERGR